MRLFFSLILFAFALQTTGVVGICCSGCQVSHIIYRPGDTTPDPNVYNNWPDVQNAVDEIDGAASVYIDSSLAGDGMAHIPAGTWNGYGTAMMYSYGTFSVLYIEDGGVLQDWAGLDNIQVLAECVTTAAFSFGQYKSFRMTDFAHINNNPNSTVAAIHITSDMGNLAIYSDLSGFSNLYAGSVPLVYVDDAATGIFYITESSTNEPFLYNGNEIAGSATSTVVWESDASQTNLNSGLFLGTLLYIPMAQAVNVVYSAATPSDWAGTPPATVQDALDRLAANTANAHPIP